MSMTCPLHPTPTIHIETQIKLIVVEHSSKQSRNVTSFFSQSSHARAFSYHDDVLLPLCEHVAFGSTTPPQPNVSIVFKRETCISMKTICFTKHAADRADQADLPYRGPSIAAWDPLTRARGHGNVSSQTNSIKYRPRSELFCSDSNFPKW